ncbi:MAG: hypothetical protein V1743_06575 [Nanoarchaeota archaeon]
MAFQDFIIYLDSIGVADVLLPFILIFTVVFAILQKTNILGSKEKRNRNFNTIVALVMGLAVVIPHVLGRYPPGTDVVDIMNSALPNVSVVIIAILMLLLIVGIFGHNINLMGGSIGGWVVIAAIITVGIIFASAANWFNMPGWLGFLNDSETQSLVVIILVFAIVIWFITREDKTPEERKERNIGENFRKLLGGPERPE